MIFIIILDWWWWIVIWLPPKLNLFYAMDFSCLFFVKTLKWAIMSFVYFPMFVNLCILCLVHLLKDQITSLNCSIKHRGVRNIESVSLLLQGLAGISWFLPSFFIEWDIDPSCEFSTLIPSRFTMSNKHNLNVIGFWFIIFRVVDFSKINFIKIWYLGLCLLGSLQELNLVVLENALVNDLRNVVKKTVSFWLLILDARQSSL